MTLIILLIVILVERVALNSTTWQVERYLDWYGKKFSGKVKSNETLSLLLFVAAPATVIGIVLYLFESKLLYFIASLFVLAVVLGNSQVRQFYRQYLNASQREDTEAASILHFKIMGEPAEQEEIKESIGETLIWVNLKYYAAPIFYFILFGIPGVIFYATVIYSLEQKGQSFSLSEQHQATLQQWTEWLLWVPARLVSVGYMFVGHFGSGLEAWLRYALNMNKNSHFVVTKVALAAEGLTDDSEEKSTTSLNNAELMVRLAKRNMVLFIVVVALLTIYGLIV